jgi:hypothetical protein
MKHKRIKEGSITLNLANPNTHRASFAGATEGFFFLGEAASAGLAAVALAKVDGFAFLLTPKGRRREVKRQADTY